MRDKFYKNININWLDFIGLTTIISCGFIFTLKFSSITDIGLYDESNYLLWGYNIRHTIPSAESGLGYTFWYYLLSLIQPDKVKIYYINAKILTILLPITLYVGLRSIKTTVFFSFISALFLLISVSNFPMTPKVSQFGVVLMLSGLSLSFFLKKLQYKLCVFILISLLIAYSRPEFYISWIIFVFISFVYLFINFRNEFLSKVIPISIVFFLSLYLIGTLGRPMGDGSRSLLAFGQHYAANWVNWNGSSVNPWTNWDTFFKADFKDSVSIIDALYKNPSAFFHHIITNLHNIPSRVAGMLSLIYSNKLFDLNAEQGKIIIISSAIYLCVVLGLAYKNKMPSKVNFNLQISPFEILLLIILLLPSLISVLVIGPRDHYLIFVLILLVIILFALIINPLVNAIKQYLNASQSNVLTFTVIGIFSLFLIRPMTEYVVPQAPDNLNTIQFIKSLNINEKVNLLEAEGGYDIYLSNNFSRIPEYAKGEAFDIFMNKNSINAIVVSSALKNDPRYNSDQKWLSFLADPISFNFSVLEIPHVNDRRLIIKKDLLKN